MLIIKKIKEELKATASIIRQVRNAGKNASRTGVWEGPKDAKPLYLLVPEFRHKHIAYCMLRGKAYEVIEPKVNDGNEPNWSIIDAYLESWKETLSAEQEAWLATQQTLRVG